MADTNAVRDSSNALTAEWARLLDPGKNAVYSGAGAVWCLGMLLAGSAGAARDELETALRLSGDVAPEALADLRRLLLDAAGVTGDTGLWVRSDISIRPEFGQKFPDMTVDTLPADPEMLDAWAERSTGGLITRFPRVIDPDTLLVIASAIAADANWTHPFGESSGRWRGGERWVGWLNRSDRNLDLAAIIETGSSAISRLICETEGGFDVHLLAGPDGEAPAAVIDAGVRAIEDRAAVRPGSELKPGDAAGVLKVIEIETTDPTPILMCGVPAFDIKAEHTLTDHAEAFGLLSAMDDTRGHFPEISDFPLAVQIVVQSACAAFSAKGFRAAAVTVAAAMAGAAMPQTLHTTRLIEVEFNRPFGFLVVDRNCGLVLFAGWVAEVDDSLVEFEYEFADDQLRAIAEHVSD